MFSYNHSLPHQHPITPFGHLRRHAFGLSNIAGSTHTGPVRHQEVIEHLISGFNSVLESSNFDHLQARVAKIDLGVTLFTLASVLCGIASHPAFLIAARFLQAVGGAILTPTSLAMILSEFPREKRSSAVSLWAQ